MLQAAKHFWLAAVKHRKRDERGRLPTLTARTLIGEKARHHPRQLGVVPLLMGLVDPTCYLLALLQVLVGLGS